jgi:hypothetical protein
MSLSRLTHWPTVSTWAAVALAATIAASGTRVAAEDFYTLASVQRVVVHDGAAVRLTANGPVAFAILPDTGAPPGGQRIRLRLYGVNGHADGAVTPVDGASVSATPDNNGNLDVVVTATAPLDASRPFDVRPGPGTSSVDVVLRTLP